MRNSIYFFVLFLITSCGGNGDDNPKFTTLEILVENTNGTGFDAPIEVTLYASLEDWLANRNPLYSTVLPIKVGVNQLLWSSQIVDPGIYFVDAHSQGGIQYLSNWESELAINVFGDQANTYTVALNENQSYLLSTGETSWLLSEYISNGVDLLDTCNVSNSQTFIQGQRDGLYNYSPQEPLCNPGDTIDIQGAWVLNNSTSTTLQISQGPFQGTYDFSVGLSTLSLFNSDTANQKSIKFTRTIP